MAQTVIVEKKDKLKPNLEMKNSQKQDNRPPLFRKMNYILMIVGVVILAAGYILLYAPGSADPAQFDETIFDTRRLVVSPIMMALGLLIEIFAIMWHPCQKKEEVQ